MITIVNKTDCCGCSACEKACPKQCIQLFPDQEGFLYPKIEREKCIDCGLCNKVCPIQQSAKQVENKGVYAIKNKAEDVRLASSSGGVFSLLASQVIASGGVVFGAVMDGTKVVHTAIETAEELPRLRGSKYVQSHMGDAFAQAQHCLKEGRQVLFSGTPCQIAGLTTFLRKPYENLLLVDCICMGVPSPMVWEKYVAFLEENQGKKATKVIFRDKSTGWKNYNLRVEFEDSTQYKKPHRDDRYLKAFGKCLMLRPSCHACEFKGFHTMADITLGDYWGIQTLFSDFDDDKGVSLVLTHSQKGEEKLSAIQEDLIIREATLDHAIQTHPSMMKSIASSPMREPFFTAIAKGEQIAPTLSYYAKDSLAEKTKHLAGRILRKLKLRK